MNNGAGETFVLERIRHERIYLLYEIVHSGQTE